jgi:hypothetical protein
VLFVYLSDTRDHAFVVNVGDSLKRFTPCRRARQRQAPETQRKCAGGRALLGSPPPTHGVAVGDIECGTGEDRLVAMGSGVTMLAPHIGRIP